MKLVARAVLMLLISIVMAATTGWGVLKRRFHINAAAKAADQAADFSRRIRAGLPMAA